MTLDRERLDELDPVHANAIVIVQALLDHQTPAGERQQTLEPGLAIESCLVAAAAILETSREEGMERQAKALAQSLVTYAKSFRKEHAASGASALEQLGAAEVTKTSLN